MIIALPQHPGLELGFTILIGVERLAVRWESNGATPTERAGIDHQLSTFVEGHPGDRRPPCKGPGLVAPPRCKSEGRQERSITLNGVAGLHLQLADKTDRPQLVGVDELIFHLDTKAARGE